jgi:hypothetical protein
MGFVADRTDDETPSMIKAILVIVSLPILIAADAFLIMRLWEWFIAPIFHLPTLRLMQAAGLSVFAGSLQIYRGKENRSSDEIVADWMTRCVVLLLTGWGIKAWL